MRYIGELGLFCWKSSSIHHQQTQIRKQFQWSGEGTQDVTMCISTLEGN